MNQQAIDQEGHSDTSKACIARGIALDDSLGTVRNYTCERISLSETITQYVQGVEAVSFQDCPEEFTKAFQQHLEAWTQMIEVSDHYPDLRGEMQDLFDILEVSEHQDEFQPRLAAIWDAWKEVEGVMGE